MDNLTEVGAAVAARRKELGLKQQTVATLAGVTPAMLSRLEHGRVAEFGTRKLLKLLNVLGLEVAFTPIGAAGMLDELRKERGGRP